MDAKDFFENEGLLNGRSIAWSKLTYEVAFPTHEIYFNGKIYVLGEGMVWQGDMDLNFDREKLEKVSAELQKDLYILGPTEEDDLNDNEIIAKSSTKIKYQ
jgi:hypothetical protein